MRCSRIRSLIALLAAQVLLILFLPTAAGAAAPVETDTWAAVFQVDLANDWVQGWGWIENSTVTVSGWADATDMAAAPVFEQPIQVDGSKYFQASFRADGYNVPLVTGMGFAVTGNVLMWNPNTQQDEVTSVTKVLTDTFVEITGFDIAGDVISGVQATPGGFHVCAGADWAGYGSGCGFDSQSSTGLTVNGDRTWSWDTTAVGLDLVPGIVQAQAGGQDLNGDVVGSGDRPVPWPHLYAQYPYGVRAEGFGFDADDAGLAVSLTATWPGEQAVQLAGTVGADGVATFPHERPLVPGTELEYTGPRPPFLVGTGDITRHLTVAPPQLTDVDVATSTVTGLATPGANLMLYPYEANPTDWVRRHVVADAGGGFSAQFSVPGDEAFEDATLTMTPEGGIGAEEWDPDFDITASGRPNTLVSPEISVDPDAALSNGEPVQVQGSGFPQGDTRLIQCRTEGGAEGCALGTMTGPIPTGGDGSFTFGYSVTRYLWTQSGAVDCGAAPGACSVVAFQGGGEVKASAALSFLPPLELSLTLAPTGSVNKASGRATVSGTVTCSDPGWVGISGELWQRVGRRSVAHGTFSIGVFCSGAAPTGWSAVVSPSGSPTVPFGTGVAELTAGTSQDRYGDHAEAGATVNVSLKVPKAR